MALTLNMTHTVRSKAEQEKAVEILDSMDVPNSIAAKDTVLLVRSPHILESELQTYLQAFSQLVRPCVGTEFALGVEAWENIYTPESIVEMVENGY